MYLISYFLKLFACQQSIQLYYALIFVDGRAIAVFRLLEFVVWLWFLYAIECEKSNNNNNNSDNNEHNRPAATGQHTHIEPIDQR